MGPVEQQDLRIRNGNSLEGGTNSFSRNFVIWESEHMAISPDGKLAATAPYFGEKSFLQVLEFDTGKDLFLIDSSERGDAKTLGFVDGVEALVSVHKIVDELGTKSYRLVRWNLRGEQLVERIFDFGIASLDVSPDGASLLLGCSDKKVRILDSMDFKVLRTLRAHDREVGIVRLHPSGKFFVTGSVDNIIKFWALETLRLKRRIIKCEGAVRFLEFNPSGRTLAAYSDDRFIRVWKDKTGDWNTPDLKVDMDGYLETLRRNPVTQERFIEKVSR